MVTRKGLGLEFYLYSLPPTLRNCEHALEEIGMPGTNINSHGVDLQVITAVRMGM